MTNLKKRRTKRSTALKEDIFIHLDALYRSAYRSKNFSVALKVLELGLKAHSTNKTKPLFQLKDLSDDDLKQLIEELESF